MQLTQSSKFSKDANSIQGMSNNINSQQNNHGNKQIIKEKQSGQNNGKQQGRNDITQIQVENLLKENESMNAIIRNKNQQIINLKSQLKGVPQTFSDYKKNTKEIYYMNNFIQSTGKNTVDIDSALYQIKALTKQRDDLKKHCEALEFNIISNQHTQNKPNAHMLISSAQYDNINDHNNNSKVIKQYEEQITSMASQLSTLHQLEAELGQMVQERNLILSDFEGMRNELINRINYCEHLENTLRNLQHELNQYRANQKLGSQQQLQNLMNKNAFLEAQLVKINKTLNEKQEKLSEIQLGRSGYIQVTKEAFQSMQSNIASLQQKVNQSSENQRKEIEKSTNLQIQLNRLQKEISDKNRKASSEIEKLAKLENEKNQLMTGLSTLKIELKQNQKKLQQKSFQFDKLRLENEKNKKLLGVTNDTLAEIQNLKRKFGEIEQCLKKIVQAIRKMEQSYDFIRDQTQKAYQNVEESKKKWESYDNILKRQNEQILRLKQVCRKRLDEIDSNIEVNLNLQSKLRQLSARNKDMGEEIESYICANSYISPNTQLTY